MARQVTVITPENIPLTLELAGIGTRLGALLLDTAIQIGVTAIVGIAGLIAAAFMAIGGLGSVGIALIIIAVFLIWFGYFILFEALWNGQTPGKRAFGLRVVRDGGYPVGFFPAATRNLVRIADFLPLGYGLGALIIFFQPEYKRGGDLVAGTIVVKERPTNPLLAFNTGPTGATAETGGALPATVHNPYDVLSPDELALLRRFVLRRFEMTPDDGERLAYRLVVPLVPKLNLTFMPGVAPRYADLATVLMQAADERETELERSERY